MREVTPAIVPFVREQFPAFYETDGDAFVSFVEAYYDWLEQESGVLNLSRGIYNLRDVDKTIDDFVIYFRTKYLANFGYLAEVDIRKLVKHSSELFGTKGTEQGFRLLFQLLFNQEINVYYPGNDVLRASDGKWFQPRYLEISANIKNVTYLYKEITGTTSGAKAFVEGIVRRTIGARVFDVFYLSNIRGEFQSGERITSDGVVAGSPVVLGSLIEIDITNGGANYEIGDILDITDASGVNGKARVTEIENATGKVNFTLNDGGSGYRIDADVLISDKTLKINSASTTSFSIFEPVTMPIQTVGYTSGNGGALTQGAVIVGTEAVGNTIVANGVILNSNSTYAIINLRFGDFLAADDLYNALHHSLIANVANTDATGNFMAYSSNNSTVGIDNITGTYYVYGQLNFETTNATAIVETIYTGANASFSIGTLTDTDAVELWTDLVGANNEEGVPFLEIVLDGSNANTASNTYGFPKPSTGYDTTLDSLIELALDHDSFDVGTIASINHIRPGADYNADPSIIVFDQLTAGFDRRDIILNITNAVGVLLTGERVEQDIQVPGYDLTIVYDSGTFTPSEGVVQVTSGAEGTVVSGNSTHLIISSYNEIPFIVGANVVGQESAAIANVTANTYLATQVTAGGKVRSANTSTVVIRPQTLSTLFDTRYQIVGQISNATANITTISSDNNSLAMGLNANVTGRVVTANGVISIAVPVDSGFGYVDGEEATFTNEDNLTVATGTIHLNSFGTGTGYWKNTDGFLSADKFLHDNNYYQEYAYEIQTGISLSRYADVLKRSFHIAGTRLFGKVVRVEKLRDSELSIDGSVST